MRPPSLGLTLRADPETLAQFDGLASVLGVSRSRLALAAIEDCVDTALADPTLREMVYALPAVAAFGVQRPARSAGEGGGRNMYGDPPDTLDPARGDGVSPGTVSGADRRQPDTTGGDVAKQGGAWRTALFGSKRRKVQRDRGRPDTSPPMTLASVQLYPCPPLRARLTEQGCEQNRARPRDRALDECGGCPGVVALAEESI